MNRSSTTLPMPLLIGGSLVMALSLGALAWLLLKEQQENAPYAGSASAPHQVPTTQRPNTSSGSSTRNRSTTPSPPRRATSPEPDWEGMAWNMRLESIARQWAGTRTLVLVPDETLTPMVNTLLNAKKGFWVNDDVESVRAVFASLPDKVAVASLSRVFYNLTSRKTDYDGETDLWKHLDSFMNHRELKKYAPLPSKNYRLR